MYEGKGREREGEKREGGREGGRGESKTDRLTD